MKRDLYVYVDIDDTIVRSAGSKRIPIPNVIKQVRNLKEQGAILFCWSSGGAEYAKGAAEEFGIADCFREFLPKPNILIDDQEMSTWKSFFQIHPASCSSESLQNCMRKLENGS